MCGITGFVDFSSQTSEDVIASMTNALISRGPDDSGVCVSHTPNAIVALGHRRLSIIDLSKNGSQPMFFENLEIVFNGEIYMDPTC